MKFQFPSAVPEIPVKNLSEALSYYSTRLGFTIDWRDEQLGLAGISRGNCRIFVSNEEFRSDRGPVGPTITWLNLDGKEEVDELYREWSTNGAHMTSAPESKPWGLHEFAAMDLDKNLFRVFYDFGTPQQSVDCLVVE